MFTRTSLARTAALAFLIALVLSACGGDDPNQGIVTIDNQSGMDLGWITDVNGQSVDEILEGEVTARPLEAGAEGQVGFDGSEATGWCEPETVTHLVVAGIEFDVPWELAIADGQDLEVLDTFGPGHCWGDREVTVVIDAP